MCKVFIKISTGHSLAFVQGACSERNDSSQHESYSMTFEGLAEYVGSAITICGEYSVGVLCVWTESLPDLE